MKNIYLSILFLCVVGCYPYSTLTLVNPNNLKFKLGQAVKVDLQVYKNCDGVVTGYVKYYDANLANDYTYYIELRCPNSVTGTIMIDEQNLTLNEKP